MLPMIYDFFDAMPMMREFNTASPAINVTESSKDYKLEMAVPGATKEDYKIQLTEDGNLLVTLEKKAQTEEKPENGRRYLRREFNYQKFSQSFTLPDDVEREKINAAVNNGVLEVELPKMEKEALPTCRQIEIK